MVRIEYGDLSVCDDCAALIANGDGPDGQAALVFDQWGDLARGLVLACSECDETCDTFSTRRCDGCGSYLAGSRHAAAVLVSD